MKKISEQQKLRIWAAADDLVASEDIEAPTNEQVRESLGGGSMSDISPAMRMWKDARAEKQVIAHAIPAEAKQAIDAAGLTIWRAASDMANNRLKSVQEDAQKRVNSAESERDELLTEIERLESLSETSKAEASEKTQALSEAEKLIATQKSSIIDLKDQMKESDAKIDRLTTLGARKEQAFDEAEKKLTAKTDELKNALTKINTLNEAVTEKNGDLKAARSKINDLELNNSTQFNQLNELRASDATKSTENAALSAKLDVALNQVNELKKSADMASLLKGKLESNEIQIEGLKTDLQNALVAEKNAIIHSGVLEGRLEATKKN